MTINRIPNYGHLDLALRTRCPKHERKFHNKMKQVLYLQEHFPQSCSAELGIPQDRGLFGFWRRFGSVTGLPVEPAPSPQPGQKPKILAARRYIFSVNALAHLIG
jgi:hypothetical protein